VKQGQVRTASLEGRCHCYCMCPCLMLHDTARTTDRITPAESSTCQHCMQDVKQDICGCVHLASDLRSSRTHPCFINAVYCFPPELAA
jgi:hypothetical protein